MKSIIVGLAVLLILVTFPLQSALDVMNEYRMRTFDGIVHNACQKARNDGYFTQANIDEMKASILNAFPGVTESELVISVTTTPKYRTNMFDVRETIEYEIKVPIKSIVAAAGFFGISPSDNSAMYGAKGYVLSEVPMP